MKKSLFYHRSCNENTCNYCPSEAIHVLEIIDNEQNIKVKIELCKIHGEYLANGIKSN